MRRPRCWFRVDAPEVSAADQPPSVLILSASMGAGYNGAANEMAARLRSEGHEAHVRDLLDAAPLRLGALMRRSYEIELRHLPSAYDATYRVWYRVPWLCPVVTWLVCLLTRRRVLRWIRRDAAGIVVSTYPLATICLGRLRQLGRLRIPAVNFITDFGVHPLWVHKGVDLHLAVHHLPADDARRQTGRPAIACGPLVADRYHPSTAATPAARRAARLRLGLGEDDRAVLIVAGSWGVGSVEHTFRAIAEGGRYVPVVVCGRDDVLRARLERLAGTIGERAVVLGWTDEMPQLMAACDAMVENAGGLTSFEAMRIGLPVISFDPIAGHGKENTAAMARAGVSCLAADPAQLLVALAAVTRPSPQRGAMVAAGTAMFVGNGAQLVSHASRPAAVAALPAPARARVVWASATRTAAGLFALAAIGWGGMTTGVGVAASAAGAGVAQPEPHAGQVAFVAVRLDAVELQDPSLAARLRRLGVSVVVDGDAARVAPGAVRALARAGVDVENGGHGFWYDHHGRPDSPQLWTRASRDAAAGEALSSLVGHQVPYMVLGRRINGFDLLDAHHARETLVLATDNVVVGQTRLPVADQLHPRSILLVNGIQATPAAVAATLTRVEGILRQAHLAWRPVSALR